MSAPGVTAADVRAALLAAHRGQQRDEFLSAQLTAAWLDIERGAPLAAAALLDELEPLPAGEFRGRAMFLRGLCRRACGGDALPWLDAAVAELRDADWLAEALLARAVDRSLRPGDAEADLTAAAELFTANGNTERAACCTHHRGFLAYRRGDPPAALALFERAESAGLRLGRHPELLADRAVVLLAAGLRTEAREALERAVRLLGRGDRLSLLADAVLAAAECALRAGDCGVASHTADTAVRLFRAQERPSPACAAAAVGMRARLSAGDAGAGRVAEAVRLAAECRDRGWPEQAAELWSTAAAVCESAHTARSLLRVVAWQRFAATARLRELGWLAAARLAELAGDDRAVLDAAGAGLSDVDSSGLRSVEPRCAGAEAEALAELGLAAATRLADPRAVLAWTDRLRSAGDARPTSDPALQRALIALRAKETGDPAGAEREVRRAAASSCGQSGMSTPELSALTGELGDRVLVSFFRSGETIRAITVHNGLFTSMPVAAVGTVERLVRELRFAQLRWLRGGSERAAAAARRSAADLEAVLFPGVPRTGLVVVPTAPLHTVPWASLPSWRGLPVSVAPSAAAWLRATAADRATRAGTVLVSGPGLAHAAAEVAALDDGAATVLTGADSTVDAVLAALSGVDLAHLAVHGEFRAGQPLLSALRLADGRIYGHDLHRLPRAPRRVVLSACDAGLTAAGTPDRCLGLGTALLHAGSASVLASVAPVPDAAAVELMRTLHTLLRNGVPPAAALARAQAEHGDLGFIALGA